MLETRLREALGASEAAPRTQLEALEELAEELCEKYDFPIFEGGPDEPSRP